MLGFVALGGCGDRSKPAVSSPEKPRVETELAFTTLTPDAYKSLGIVSEPASVEAVQAFIQATGWIMAPPGKEVTITAPVAGYVRLPPKRLSPRPGESLREGTELFSIEPVLSPVEQIQLATLKRGVESEWNKAQATMKVAEADVERIRELHKQGLRGLQDLEQAQVRFDHAQEDLKSALDKQKLFEHPARPILAPQGGTILSVQASPGQYVPAGAPLLTAADLTQRWLRVPIAEHDLPAVAFDESVKAMVNREMGRLNAAPVGVVPQVDLLRHTADLLYELASKDKEVMLAKDQMMTVFVPLTRKQKETVVPYDAVVFDAFGGSWIYLERPEEGGRHRFERRRVELGPTVEKGVVIRPLAAAGEKIVTRGAGILFSREFHKTPVRP